MTVASRVISSVRQRRHDAARRAATKAANSYIAAHPDLAEAIAQADAVSQSTGVSRVDYATLYRAVLQLGARTVLECGTGKSTYVLAAALRALQAKSGGQVRLVSMDHNENWHRHAKEAFPFDQFPFVEMRHSPSTEYAYAFIRGTAYAELPALPYDLVFVDGPGQEIDGSPACNMDFIRMAAASERPIAALVDNRKTTMLAYTMLLGSRVAFTPRGLGVVQPVTRDAFNNLKHRCVTEVFPRTVRAIHCDPIAFVGQSADR